VNKEKSFLMADETGTKHAIDMFMNVERVKKANSAKHKSLVAQQDAAKDVIHKYMETHQVQYVTVSEGHYIVRSQKVTKHPLSTDFLIAAYCSFQQQKGRTIQPQEGREFASCIEGHQVRLATVKPASLTASESKPLNVMF
jgi:hypothetical protein